MTTREMIQKLCELYHMEHTWAVLNNSLAPFLSDPASCQYHHAYPGGLADHSIGVFFRLVRTASDGIQDNPSLFKIAIVHDFCKIGTYTQTMKSQKVKGKDGKFLLNSYGKPVWEDVEGYEKAPFPSPVMGHGDSSVLIALRHGIELTDSEIMCVRWHMGAYDTHEGEDSYRMSQAIEMVPLIGLVQAADLMDAKCPQSEIDRDNSFITLMREADSSVQCPFSN